MYIIKVIKKSSLIFYGFLLVFIIVLALLVSDSPYIATTTNGMDWQGILEELFEVRNECVLNGYQDELESIYLTGERNGLWAYQNELKRSEYLKNWAAKQGVKFLGISSTIVIRRTKAVGRGYSFYIICSTEYEYAYADEMHTRNMFRVGTYHSLDLIPEDQGYIISREWYDDPFSTTLDLKHMPDDMTANIMTRSPKDISGLSAQRISAVEYADFYCGAASGGENDYKYNAQYTDYNALGGDCANFVSQVLYEGGGFKKSGGWNYHNGKGSLAWIKAENLTGFMLYSGRATLISKGKYKDVYQHAYSLLPGDIVSYTKKGKIAHIAVVTALDSKGYPLVNCHNTDRYRVPFDIGWNADTTFYLINVHY